MKKLFAYLLSAACIFNLTGCDDEEASNVVSTTVNNNVGQTESNGGSGAPVNKISNALNLAVNSTDGTIEVNRMDRTNLVNAEKDSWTIFVYMCGTDLEDEDGSATADLQEMIAAKENDKVRFVVMTGGTKEWNNSAVDSDKNQIFLVENGKLNLVKEYDEMNMGKSETLENFLTYGVKNYPADKMGLILWNHGSGSINGVCFDEKYEDDSLLLSEIDTALLNVYNNTGAGYEFIGFDACLMGTYETANVLASYSKYMIGSQETVSGVGWNYKKLGNYIADNLGASGADVGKVVADNLLAEDEAYGEEYMTTMSVVDLSKIDALTESYNSFFYNVFNACRGDSSVVTTVSRAANNADNFGGNNFSEGYTNMIDMKTFVGGISSVADTTAVDKALKEAVVYSVNGSSHSNAGGLSIYYPLSIQGSEEMKIFSSICPSPYYLSILDMLQQSSVNNVAFSDYSNSNIFSDNGSWNSSTDHSDYFSYVTEDSSGGVSSGVITFEQEPGIDDDGNFYFILDQNGYDNTAYIYANVYQEMDGYDILIGETADVDVIDDYTYCDYFDGYWISLPDGQNLALYLLDYNDEYIYYSSPVLFGENVMYLRLIQSLEDGSIRIAGMTGGISDEGYASRNPEPLKAGDVITPIYEVVGSDEYCYGEEYTYDGKSQPQYGIMDEGIYDYTFVIADIYGNYYESAYACFGVEEDGSLTFYN